VIREKRTLVVEYDVAELTDDQVVALSRYVVMRWRWRQMTMASVQRCRLGTPSSSWSGSRDLGT